MSLVSINIEECRKLACHYFILSTNIGPSSTQDLGKDFLRSKILEPYKQYAIYLPYAHISRSKCDVDQMSKHYQNVKTLPK